MTCKNCGEMAEKVQRAAEKMRKLLIDGAVEIEEYATFNATAEQRDPDELNRLAEQMRKAAAGPKPVGSKNELRPLGGGSKEPKKLICPGVTLVVTRVVIKCHITAIVAPRADDGSPNRANPWRHTGDEEV